MATKKKAFWKTSEFWLTALTTVGAVGGAIVGIVPASVAGIIGAVANGAYAVARGLSKSGGK